MTFEEACKKKFEAGAKEHKQPWDKEHIDHIQEIQDELTDLWNYASLDPDDKLMQHIQVISKLLWERLCNK